MHPKTRQLINDEFNKRLLQHYSRTDHHPEHLKMSDERRMHLTCDLLGVIMGYAMRDNIDLNVAQCRAFMEKKCKWADWKFAVTENLPPASSVVPDIEDRWGRFYRNYNELEQLFDEKNTHLPRLESVKEYVINRLFEKFGVLKVWQEISEKYDPRFKSIAERIQNHDLDLFRPDMIRAYTKFLTLWNSKIPTLPPDDPLNCEPLGFDEPEKKEETESVDKPVETESVETESVETESVDKPVETEKEDESVVEEMPYEPVETAEEVFEKEEISIKKVKRLYN